MPFALLATRVITLMDLLEPLSGHMGVDLSCGDIRVPEHHLNRTEVCTSLQKVAGKGVAQKMRGDPFPNARPSAILLDVFPESLSGHPPP